LPEKTKDISAEAFEKLIPELKKKLYYKIWWVFRFMFSNKQQTKKKWS
jgi:hypothetical protein